MVKYIPLITALAAFFFLKVSNLSIRLSDTNIYFFVGNLILSGKVLYKEVFFSNFPLFAYLSSLYTIVTGKNLTLFYLTAASEVVLTTIFIYLIVYRNTKNRLIALTASFSYPFSFMVLVTSDHQTGVFAASLFAVVSFFFWQRGNVSLCSVFLVLTILTKAYFAPIAIAALAWFFQTKQKVRFLLGALGTYSVVLVPTLLLAKDQFFEQVLAFSLTRPQGVGKANIAWFFVTKDPLFFILLVFNLLSLRRNPFFFLLSFSSLAFFFLYQDTYYLYFNFLAPMLCLSLPNFVFRLQKTFSLHKLVLPSLVGLLLALNLSVYLSSFQNLQKAPIGEMVDVIKREQPKVLYGTNDITPALISLTGVPPVANVFDAHPTFFRKKLLNRDVLTKKAIEKQALLITHGASYRSIDEDILDSDVFNKEQVRAACKKVASFPVQTEGVVNRIHMFRCAYTL